MRTIVLAHGIRQFKARSQMEPLAEALEKRGINTHYANYGYVFIPTTNNKAKQAIWNAVRSGEDLAAYSNGAWAAVQAAEEGLNIRHLYLISPALNRTTTFPSNIEKITVFYSPGDKVTTKGKLWRQLTRLLPWRWKNPHGWGEMGSKGPKTDDPRVSVVMIPEEVEHSWNEYSETVEQVADVMELDI